jgi:hypothetical protein
MLKPGAPSVPMRSRLTPFLLALCACGGSQEPARTAAEASTSAGGERERPTLPELDPMVVARSLRGNEAELRDCFGASGTSIQGFMRIGFRIEATGEVANVEIESSSFADAKVTACLEEKVSNLRFEAPGEAKQARWTFVAGLKAEPGDGERAEAEKKRKKPRKDSEPRAQGVAIDSASQGSLEPEEIEDIVHAGFGLFAHCYREGLDRQPGLNGIVSMRMVIGRDGVVDSLRDSGTDIRDREVVDCVAEGFFALRFPKPRAGTVRLTYRIVFDAG